jgi:5-deoxy-D-glucuronate isomerase
MSVLPGQLFRAASSGVQVIQRFTPKQANLHWLECAEWRLEPGAQSASTTMAGRESLLFQWKGSSTIEIENRQITLAPYDVLYIPLDTPFSVSAEEEAALIQCSATASNRHPLHVSRFAELSQRDDRIRRLKGKNVYLMFDVGEAADKLVAGYTFFEPYARSWPPHNHTDQEEAYIFIKGNGAMEVYETEESLSFVHSVAEGDIVTIPFLNYHPVFSQAEPLEFIWCIAGERYWVGDKNKDFMTGKLNRLTT